MTTTITRKFVAARINVMKNLESRESGQGALEYLGMVIVAAVLIIAVVTAFSGAGFKETITTKVNEVKTSLSGFTG